MRIRAVIGATFAAGALLPALALVASADEDPPLRAAEAGPPLRPPTTVLRATETSAPAPVPSVVASGGAASATRELIVLVGGLGSHLEPEKNPFEELEKRLPSGTYDVLRFGTDFGVYNTYKPIDENALNLRDGIRSVSGGYDAVHIVTHSLGGVVTDRAFSLGLSASDGVTTYVAWAAPHDGARAARAAQTTLTLSGPARADARDLAVSVNLHDPETAAVRDLARVRAGAPPAGVVRLDLRLATDGVVRSTDASDPGVDSRVLLPGTVSEWEGHGGILKNEQALDLTLATIEQKAVPPDDRGSLLRAASQVMSEQIAERVDGIADLVVAGLCVAVLLGGIGGLFNRTFRRMLPWPPFTE